MRPRQSAIPLLIALVFVIAAMIYLSRMSYSPQPAKISVAPSERAGPADIYPIAALTPGATNPAITQANIDETICNPHWSTKSIRPPEEYTYRLKREQIGEYHDSDTRARARASPYCIGRYAEERCQAKRGLRGCGEYRMSD